MENSITSLPNSIYSVKIKFVLYSFHINFTMNANKLKQLMLSISHIMHRNLLTLWLLCNFAGFIIVCLIFQNQIFFEEFFQKYHQSVISLNTDQVQLFVGSDLGPNCFQKLSSNDASRQ